MDDRPGFGSRFLRVFLPTRTQLIGCLAIALAAVIISESTSVIQHLGVSSDALRASQGQFQDRFSGLSHSLIVANLALVVFWSAVGLVAYLICWAGYNVMIEARNELTVETQYKNLGGHKGPWIGLAVKAVMGSALIASVIGLKYALALALTLVAPVVASQTPSSIGQAIGGVAILTLSLYLIVAFFELAFSAWYRPEAFTEES
jgi:hypothetical protein